MLKALYIDHGLRLRDKLLTFTLTAVLSLVCLSDAYAAAVNSSGTSMTVTAAVPPYANLKVISQAQEIVITDADILQGYVDVNSASLFQIKNNSSKGYMLAFESTGTTFKEVHVAGPGIDTILIYGTGLVAQPYSGKLSVTLQLNYRFVLSGDISPGTYAWPLMVSVNPVL